MSVAIQQAQALLDEAATYEKGGRILNEHYNKKEYHRRRMTHLANVDRRAGIEPFNHGITAEDEADKVFEGQTPALSVQRVRQRELDLSISPLTPYPTTENTDSINDYADYPPTEWQYGDPDDYFEVRRHFPKASEDDDGDVAPLPSMANAQSGKTGAWGKRKHKRQIKAVEDEDEDAAPPTTPSRAQSVSAAQSRRAKFRRLNSPAVALASRAASLPVKLGPQYADDPPLPPNLRSDSIQPAKAKATAGTPATSTPEPTERRSKKKESKASKKAAAIAAVAAGERLPRSRAEASSAAALRKQDLLLAHRPLRRQRRKKKAVTNSAATATTDRNNEDGTTLDLMPEFWETTNYTTAEAAMGAVRCSCGAVTDGPLPFIACDAVGCDSWQHVACMGDVVPRGAAGEVDAEARYECFQCDPWAHRRMLQALRQRAP